MPERASVFQGVQIGVESTSGTPVPANRLLQAMQIIPDIDITVDMFRPMGNKYITVAAPGKELTQAQITGKLTYTEIVYPFSSLFGAAVVTGAGPFVWTFSPGSTAADAFATFTVHQGNSVRAESWAYGLFTGMTISGSRDGFDLRGTMQGQAITDGITMTASPTALALLPVLGRQVSVFYDPTSGGLGTTKLGRVLSLEFSYSNKYSPLWAVDNTVSSYVAMVERAPTPTLKLVVEADAAGMALLTDARSGGSAYVRIAAASGTSSIQLDMAVKHNNPDAYRDQDGVYAIGWNMQLAHDAAWGPGRSMLAVVTNSLAAL